MTGSLLHQIRTVPKQYQILLDRSVPHVLQRWLVVALLLLIFLARVILSQGWYIECYALGIYLLNLLLAFLTPKFDPSVKDDERAADAEEGATGSAARDEEFKPFIRRLPEFKFWHHSTCATLLALFLTLFPFTDIPVFWPILLFYFIVLFSLTMRRQIQHMVKYRYLPFDIGKRRFGPNS